MEILTLFPVLRTLQKCFLFGICWQLFLFKFQSVSFLSCVAMNEHESWAVWAAVKHSVVDRENTPRKGAELY
jgi:hypothetical protein